MSDIKFLEEVRDAIENDSDAYWEFNGREDAKRLLDIIRGYQTRVEQMEEVLHAAKETRDKLKDGGIWPRNGEAWNRLNTACRVAESMGLPESQCVLCECYFYPTLKMANCGYSLCPDCSIDKLHAVDFENRSIKEKIKIFVAAYKAEFGEHLFNDDRLDITIAALEKIANP